MNIRPGHEWEPFEGLATSADRDAGVSRVGPVRRRKRAPPEGAPIEVPDALDVTIQPEMSTQAGFGALLNELGRGTSPLADRIVTTSPDVTISTNLGAWVNRRGLFAREHMTDTFRSERIPSTFTWEYSPKGQHIELGIAESNLFTLLSALGLSHSINGERLHSDRNAVRSLHRARARCAELRLLSGRPVYRRGYAVRHYARARRRRAPIHRAAADRHGARRARCLRAGVRRRARGNPPLLVRLHSKGRR